MIHLGLAHFSKTKVVGPIIWNLDGFIPVQNSEKHLVLACENSVGFGLIKNAFLKQLYVVKNTKIGFIGIILKCQTIAI